ncbi:MAG: response regulator [Rubrivivax sp.]|nr:response regulator [Rubrivivax sp.]
MDLPAPAAARILVVDDDHGLRSLLADYLSSSGFIVDGAADGVQMRACMARAWPDAIVLDLMLPGEDGLSLARELRRRSGVPILMLSARGEEIDRVVGLEVGADDYLPKPFGPRELLARLRALLRRARPDPAEAAGAAPDVVDGGAAHLHRFGPFTLDTQAWRLLRDGAEMVVSSGEVELLRLFVEHPHRVLSRDTLVDWLKGYERGAYDRSIDVRVTRLRRKIEPDPARPVYIRTVRGEGYLFHPTGGAA